VEGLPLRKNPQVEAAERTDPNPSLADAVAAQVREFDYKPIVLGKVVLLQKRYSDPQDTPSVTLEEAVTAMGDMARILRSVVPKVRRGSQYVAWIMDSLTPEQRKALEAGTLAVRDLAGGEQQQAMNHWVCSILFRNIVTFAEPVSALFQPPLDPILTVTDAPDTQAHSRTFLIAGSPDEPSGHFPLEGGVDESISDSTPLYGPSPDPAYTLGKIVSRINEYGKDKPGTPPIVLDAMFVDKSAMLVGDVSLASSEAFGQGLALMYGLARQVGTQKEVILTRRSVRVTAGDLTPDKLPALLERLLPDPVRRAIGFDTYARKKQELAARRQRLWRSDLLGKPEIFVEDRKIEEEGTQLERVPKKGVAWSVRRLRERVKSQGKDASPPLRIPLSKLDAPTRNLIASTFLLQLGNEYLVRMADLPDWLREYPSLVSSGRIFLTGGVERNERGIQFAAVDIMQILPNGETRSLVGSTARYPPEQ
jgi:hypothetical protein